MASSMASDEIHSSSLEEWTMYQCPKCKCLLKDAVQTSCGHWLCEECAKKLASQSQSINPILCPRTDCGKKLENVVDHDKMYFPDKFVRRQINKFLVRCRYYRNKCEWTGPLIEQLKHIETCLYEQEKCEYCHEDFDNKSKLKAHEKNCPKALMTCPYVEYGCEITKQMTRAECDKHLEAEVATHLRIVVPVLRKLLADKKEMEKLMKKHVYYDVVKSVTHTPPLSCHYNGDIKPFHNTGSPETAEPIIPDDDNPELDILKKQLASKDSQIHHLQDKVEATVLAKTTENEDRDFRLSLMENSNYDGTMLWKIPQFTQRMDDARTGKYTSIFSLPFYSGRYGFKMCLRLYILGDGIGKGSHMSLFFVLMKGEFDNILQWPFNHKVTFKLLNQCSGRDVVDLFQPDPLSSSFQKPKTDMNIASGCPRFVSLTELMQNGFIVDDAVFIKVKVDIISAQ